ncbi:MAG: GNAT family N-acetyltransferase [Spirochaetaceae bacterium]|jgi:GNAT superfamily N-acetyltransferase|nr:GNAT family N-acetyltransferase [Spirochaetaceae bacterium]
MGYLIRALLEAELDEASALLAAVFQDRPFYRYLAPDDTERREFLAENFATRLREGFGVSDIQAACLPDGAGGRIVGIAVWAPPRQTREDAPPHEDAFARFSAPLRERFFRFLGILHDGKNEALREAAGQPVWALAPLAVLPAEWGKGAGGALLRSKLRELDTRKARCFLGTQDAENAALYGHFGFKIMRKDPLPGSELVHHTMLR